MVYLPVLSTEIKHINIDVAEQLHRNIFARILFSRNKNLAALILNGFSHKYIEHAHNEHPNKENVS